MEASAKKNMPLKRVSIGNTGLKVNRLAFGGIPIQALAEAEAVEIVRYAIEKGIDFIDTSRVYTTSERRIGLALQRIDKPVVLASKSYERTADGIRSDLETSLKELQRDSIDLYQCHYVRDEAEYDRVIGSRGALEGLIKAKEEGLIDHFGITSHSLDLYDRILDDGLFETIMVCFSIMEPMARKKIIPKAVRRKVGVFAMKTFSGGIIDNARVALKFVLSQPNIIILAGVARKDHIDENWEIFQKGDYQFSPEEQQVLKNIQHRHEKNFCRRCDYCQPCSQGIFIQMVLNLKPIVKRLGKNTLTDPQRTELLAKARQCTECGECVAKCPYQLPIPELIKENLEWVEKQLKSS